MLYSSQHDNKNEDCVEYKELDLENILERGFTWEDLQLGREEIIDTNAHFDLWDNLVEHYSK